MNYRMTGEKFNLFLIVIISGGISLLSLIYPEIYQDNAFTVSAWFGNDIITLIIACPLLLLLTLMLKRDSQLVRILIMGFLWYMIYNYIFYVYGTAFNSLFLFYIVVVLLSAYRLLKNIIDYGNEMVAIARGHEFKGLEKMTGIYFIVFSLILGTLWILMSLASMFTGTIPTHVIQTGHVTAMVFATDLLLLIPVTFYAGVMTLKKHPWSIALILILLTKCSTYSYVLVTMHIVQVVSGQTGDPFILLWFILGGLATILQIKLILKYKTDKTKIVEAH